VPGAKTLASSTHKMSAILLVQLRRSLRQIQGRLRCPARLGRHGNGDPV